MGTRCEGCIYGNGSQVSSICAKNSKNFSAGTFYGKNWAGSEHRPTQPRPAHSRPPLILVPPSPHVATQHALSPQHALWPQHTICSILVLAAFSSSPSPNVATQHALWAQHTLCPILTPASPLRILVPAHPHPCIYPRPTLPRSKHYGRSTPFRAFHQGRTRQTHCKFTPAWVISSPCKNLAIHPPAPATLRVL